MPIVLLEGFWELSFSWKKQNDFSLSWTELQSTSNKALSPNNNIYIHTILHTLIILPVEG
jgi:hypothetical protein